MVGKAMARIKKITIEFDDGTVTKMTRKQFISLIRDISYGTVREALGLASKRGRGRGRKESRLAKPT